MSEEKFTLINARLRAANFLTYDKKIYYFSELEDISQASQELL